MPKRLVLELSEDIHKMIKIKAAKEDKSMREVFTSLIREWLGDDLKTKKNFKSK